MPVIPNKLTLDNRESTTLKKLYDVAIGFFGAAAATYVSGLCLYLATKRLPTNWLKAWWALPLPYVLLTVAANELIYVVAALLFWRKRKFIAIGIMVFAVLEALGGALQF